MPPVGIGVRLRELSGMIAEFVAPSSAKRKCSRIGVSTEGEID